MRTSVSACLIPPRRIVLRVLLWPVYLPPRPPCTSPQPRPEPAGHPPREACPERKILSWGLCGQTESGWIIEWIQSEELTPVSAENKSRSTPPLGSSVPLACTEIPIPAKAIEAASTQAVILFALRTIFISSPTEGMYINLAVADGANAAVAAGNYCRNLSGQG